MKQRDITSMILSLVVLGMIITASAKWHEAGLTELIIVGVVLLSGLALAWINNPYAYDSFPFDKIDSKGRLMHWVVWAMTYVPIFVYLQMSSGNVLWKIILGVVFLSGSILTKLEAKKLEKLEKED